MLRGCHRNAKWKKRRFCGQRASSSTCASTRRFPLFAAQNDVIHNIPSSTATTSTLLNLLLPLLLCFRSNETCATLEKQKEIRKNPLPWKKGKGYVFVADGEHLPIVRKNIEMSQLLRPARVRRRNARTRHSWTHHPLKKCGTALPDREDFQGILSFAVRF